MKKKSCLVLFSGGLDSILAVRMLLEQGVRVKALIFKSFFWNTDQAEKTVQKMKIAYQVVDFSKKHLQLVKNPPHGYGKAANPCLDCHLLMLKQAKQLMKSRFDFVATGEVLGERPFSQNKQSLTIIARESGLKELLLRPLSAKLLPISKSEKEGWVDREKLGAIKGRPRQPQMALAKKFKIKSYPQPAGGCLLCEKDFGQKLFKMFQKWSQTDGNDIALLKLGRLFWEKKTLIALGRNQEENEKLIRFKKESDVLITPKNFPGPTALIRGKEIKKEVVGKAKELIIRYSKPVASPTFSHIS